MREILFKAKRIDNGEWVEGYFVKLLKDMCYIIDKDTFSHYLVDENTLCQYTGMTDKNGCRIWENDVVEIPKEDDYFKVIWSDTEARYEMQSDSLVVDFDNYWSYEIEVIGTKFDNPELLGG